MQARCRRMGDPLRSSCSLSPDRAFRYGRLNLHSPICVRLPGEMHRFLLNPYGMMFDEITASSLIMVDPEGHAIQKEDEAKINNAGFTIHSAVHMARDDAQCVIHTHTLAGMAIAAQEQGLLPLNQKSMCFYGNIAYHHYEGIALDLGERDRLVRDLGDKDVMILKHHGLLTVGRTISEAFLNITPWSNPATSRSRRRKGHKGLLYHPIMLLHTRQSSFKARTTTGTRALGRLSNDASTA